MDNKKDNIGLSLIKKKHRGLFQVFFSRLGVVLILFLIQLLFLIGAFKRFSDFLPHIYGGAIIFTIYMVLYLINSQLDPTGKITWLVVIMLVPVFGPLFFLYTQKEIGHRTFKKIMTKIIKESQDMIVQDEKVLKDLENVNPGVASLSRYISRTGSYPVYTNTQTSYFSSGQAKFKELLIQLDKAEHFIFLEYFIINEGKMWGQILEILAKKASQGLDVRVMYDGTCEFSALPTYYPKRLEDLGIKCKVFAPLSPFVSTHYNYRDHRKIVVIDGHTAFTGGINLADEYINEFERYGYWKDTAVMLKGDAVKSFTLMFLQMWSAREKEEEFGHFLNYPSHPQIDSKGFVIPYGDFPLDDDRVGEQVYIDILNRAKDYVYIMTPYLILAGELENSLKFAAKRGVDVRILLPGIPDKKIPFAVAFTHYSPLVKAGVKIYEYKPGFVHAKSFVADDREAVVGTINLDYRSLYHHFECAAYIYGQDCIEDIKKDFLQSLEESKNINEKTIKDEKITRKIIGFIIKVIAPLL